MLGYVLRRLIAMLPIAVGVSMVCFGLVYLAPGYPLQTLLPPDADAETVARLKQLYGLDRSLPLQYLSWLGQVLTGDFGRSIATGRPVFGEMTRSLGNTVLLAGLAVLIAFTVAFARHDRRAPRRRLAGPGGQRRGHPRRVRAQLLARHSAGSRVLGGAGRAARLGHGRRRLGRLRHNALEHLRHLIFPVVTLSMVPVGIIARSARSAIAEVMAQKFVVTLRANGLPEWRAMRHVLKNALPSVLAVMGLQFGTLMGGSILVETVFSYPGSGFLLSKAILARDIPVLQGTILVLAMVFAVTYLVVDLMQSTPAPPNQARLKNKEPAR